MTFSPSFVPTRHAVRVRCRISPEATLYALFSMFCVTWRGPMDGDEILSIEPNCVLPVLPVPGVGTRAGGEGVNTLHTVPHAHSTVHSRHHALTVLCAHRTAHFEHCTLCTPRSLHIVWGSAMRTAQCRVRNVMCRLHIVHWAGCAVKVHGSRCMV